MRLLDRPAFAPRSPQRRRVSGHRRSALLIGVGDAVALFVATTLGDFELAVAYTVLTLIVLALQGSYQPRLHLHLGEQVPGLVGALAIAAVLVGALAGDAAAVGALVQGVPIAFALVLVTRALAYLVVRSFRQRNLVPTLIVGSGAVGVHLAERIIEHPEYGLRPVGFLDSYNDIAMPVPVLGHLDDLTRIVEDHEVRQVIMAFGGTRASEVVRLLRTGTGDEVEVHVVPRFFELGLGGAGPNTDQVWGIPLTRLPRPHLRVTGWHAKRLFDLIMASVAFLVLAPVLLGIAVGVKLTSPGPVLFRQQRVGQRGKAFEMLKFRTLRMSEDTSSSPTTNAERTRGVNDRVTSVGRVLRPLSLDELPQLLNVLRGDMSLVGPRPEEESFVQQFGSDVEGYADRHRVPVGMTGLAQVNGMRGDTSMTERAVFDNLYIDRWSLWWDIVILVRTVTAVVRPPQSVQVSAQPLPLGDGEPDPAMSLHRRELPVGARHRQGSAAR